MPGVLKDYRSPISRHPLHSGSGGPSAEEGRRPPSLQVLASDDRADLRADGGQTRYSRAVEPAAEHSRRLLAASLAVTLPLGGFLALGAAVSLDGKLRLDEVAFDLLRRYAPDVPLLVGSADIIRWVTIAGAALALGLFAILLVRRCAREAAFWAASLVGTLALDPVLKEAVRRPPIDPADTVSGYSFPSGSAMWSMAALAALTLLARSTRLRLISVALGAPVVLAYGVSIVYERWHFASDVLAGWCIALAWVSGLWFVLIDPPRRQRGLPGER